MKKIYAFLTLLAIAGVAAATNFVDDNVALPAAKTDRYPVTNPTQQWGAADANAVFTALNDLRTVVKRNVINAKAYGAIGNGVIDDCASINAALAAAGATVGSVYGGMVYLPKGLYRVGCQLVIPNGVGLQGDGPANTIVRASVAFNSASVVKNQFQDGTQEYAFLESLTIDGNALNGALATEAVVSFGSLFINSYIRDVIILNGSAVGLRVFASNAMGPVLLENVWVLDNKSHNVLIEETVANSQAATGIVAINLTSEHQGTNSSAIYLKGLGHTAQWNFYNTHIEQGTTALNPSPTGRTGITIDGVSHVTFQGVQLLATLATVSTGIKITNNASNVGIQINSVYNPNLINPVVQDLKNSVTYGAVNVPIFTTADVSYDRLITSPAGGTRALTVRDASAVDRAWFDSTGRLTGSSVNSAGIDLMAADTTNNRPFTVMPATGSPFSNVYGWYYPVGGGGALRERSITSGADVRQIDTGGSQFFYQPLTAQSLVTVQSGVRGALAGGTTCPTSGTHVQGEVVFFVAPTAGGFVGCVCTTAGSPGTWKTFGAISP